MRTPRDRTGVLGPAPPEDDVCDDDDAYHRRARAEAQAATRVHSRVLVVVLDAFLLTGAALVDALAWLLAEIAIKMRNSGE